MEEIQRKMTAIKKKKFKKRSESSVMHRSSSFMSKSSKDHNKSQSGIQYSD
jgi:hypothetical protein